MKKFIHSFTCAFRGVYEFIDKGRNAKIQLMAGVVALAAGFYLKFTNGEWLAVVLFVGIVLALEAINTAIEELADEITKERKESIRKVKDISAGAVLIATMTSLVVAFLVLYGKIK